ncbi:MAG: histidine phosphatase family protein [bacterium]|nr:histidine phosphatase family protein [bacterium]
MSISSKRQISQMFVMQTGQTVWDAQGRIESVPGAPLTASGAGDVERAAKELAACGTDIGVVYACESESEYETAGLIARSLGIKVRTESELGELDYGLWQGLTHEELKRRQSKMYRQWVEAPSSVRPPGGEMLEEAQSRLRAVIKGILKRHKDEAVLFVLRPVAVGLLRCMVTSDPVDQIWNHVDAEFTWGSYEMDLLSL